MVNTNSKNLVNKLATAKKINYTPLLLLGIFFFQGIIIVQLLFHGSLLLDSRNEPPTRFVELANGQTLKTRPITANERSPEVIVRFTRTMMETLFSASDTTLLTGGKILSEPGVEINDKTITEKSAIALQFVDPELMNILLSDISEVVTSDILNGSETRVLKIRYLSEPKKLENKPGYWEEEMVGNLYSYDRQDKELLASKFNKKIQIKTINYPTDMFQSLSLDLNQKIFNLEDKEYLKELFYELSNAGLEISLISSL